MCYIHIYIWYSNLCLSASFRLQTNLTILQVTATDEDSGSFGQVIYSIDSINVEGIFEVEMDTGTVWVIGNVDRETTTSYSFTILAEDGGNPPRLATADVTVILDDVNDNSPMFSQASYEGSVEEGLSAGTTVNILRVCSAYRFLAGTAVNTHRRCCVYPNVELVIV